MSDNTGVTIVATDKEALAEAFRRVARPLPDARALTLIEVPRDGAEFHTHTPPGETPRHTGVAPHLGRPRPLSKPGPY